MLGYSFGISLFKRRKQGLQRLKFNIMDATNNIYKHLYGNVVLIHKKIVTLNFGVR